MTVDEVVLFHTVARGYKPAEVESYIRELVAGVSASSERVAQLQDTIDSLITEAADQAEAMRRAEAGAAERGRTFADFGHRIGEILGLAEDEAAELRAQARAEVEATRRALAEATALARSQEESRSAASRAQAQQEADRVLSDALAEAGKVLDSAERHADARAQETDALQVQHRNAVQLATVEFNRALQSRRDSAEEEIARAAADAQHHLDEVNGRADRIEKEAELLRSRTQSHAELLATKTRVQAEQILVAATARADQVEAEAESRLIEAAGVRDRIDVQLTTLRRMLDTAWD